MKYREIKAERRVAQIVMLEMMIEEGTLNTEEMLEAKRTIKAPKAEAHMTKSDFLKHHEKQKHIGKKKQYLADAVKGLLIILVINGGFLAMCSVIQNSAVISVLTLMDSVLTGYFAIDA